MVSTNLVIAGFSKIIADYSVSQKDKQLESIIDKIKSSEGVLN